MRGADVLRARVPEAVVEKGFTHWVSVEFRQKHQKVPVELLLTNSQPYYVFFEQKFWS